MKKKVLCFGSLNIDYTYRLDHIIRRGETESSDGLQVFSGGKGLNQSIALSRAGAEVYHAGAIGSDGLFLKTLLEDSGVHTEHIRILPDIRTGHAIIQNDREGDNCIILYGGANQAITRGQVDEVLSAFGEGDYLILQNEINELAYIMEQAARRGMVTVLNPSPMNGIIEGLPLQTVRLFLLNEVEGGQLLGRELRADFSGTDMALALARRFPQAGIVLTLGAEGSIYTDGSQTIRQQACRVKAVDTTAAGDTFTGYLIAGLLEALPMEAALIRATRASAIAVQRRGAAPSIPTAAELAQWAF